MFLVVFSFISLEWCTDHDANATPLAEQHCSVQCCSPHNLAPLIASDVALNVPFIFTRFIELSNFFRPNLISTRIYRPPIV